MAKWQLNRPGTWHYPIYGFTASDGDIADITAAPDVFWDLAADQEAAETVTRWGDQGEPGGVVVYPDGWLGVFDATLRTFVPAAPADVVAGPFGQQLLTELGDTPVQDASTEVKGRIKLAGHLAGTADAPLIGYDKLGLEQLTEAARNTLGRSAVYNGAFEEVSSAFPTIPSGWSPSWALGAGGTFSIETDTPIEGEVSAKIVVAGSDDGLRARGDKTAIVAVAGTEWIVRGKVKASRGTLGPKAWLTVVHATTKAKLFDILDPDVTWVDITANVGTETVQILERITVPPGKPWMGIYLTASPALDGSGYTAWWDDVQITPAQPLPAYLAEAEIEGKAPVESPTFTGAVVVPTPTEATHAATKAYVDEHAGGGSYETAPAGSRWGIDYTDLGAWPASRPTARTDVWFDLFGASAATADPAWMIDGDARDFPA